MKNLLIFLAGGAVGAVVTAKLVEKYYRELADEEIADVVEHFKNKEKELKKIEEKVENANKTEKSEKKKKDKNTASKIINSENYGEAKLEDVEDQLINAPMESITGIEIIDPMEFGDKDGYDTKSWMYWNDDVLTNEVDEIIPEDEISGYIGDALTHFGEIEQDSVYVRNNASKIEYEILRSERDFNA